VHLSSVEVSKQIVKDAVSGLLLTAMSMKVSGFCMSLCVSLQLVYLLVYDSQFYY